MMHNATLVHPITSAKRPRSTNGIYLSQKKSTHKDAELHAWAHNHVTNLDSIWGKTQSSSSQQSWPHARLRRQGPFQGSTHINAVMRVKSHVIYTLKGESNA